MSILLIEDDRKFAANLKRSLEIENYQVDVAPDGASGLSLAMNPTYRVILLDVSLPEINGITVCRTLREKDVHTPIIMLTARGELTDRVQGLDSGADDYLIKPFVFEELNARLRSAIRRHEQKGATPLAIDDIVIDPLKHEVTRAGAVVPFSPTEYKLFLYLFQHLNMVVTRETLSRYLWQEEPPNNKLDVYVRYVRKKIEETQPHSKKILHTVKGIGYIIKE